ncbi:hypothetical protein F5Y19DRAFT_476756 [Xylariaceae sp. FL1651]|nr:hypothetical protein F5Y19DRAFT_476756 [Xylariaceae sp. FL1651]
MTVDTPSPKRRYWLLTSPRTASNMLVRILNLDEQNVRPAYNGGYFFFPSMLARIGLLDRPPQDWTPEERTEVAEGQKKSFDALQDHLAAAEEAGQKVFVKEHVIFLNDPFYETQYMHGGNFSDDELNPPQPLPARGITSSTRSPLNLTSMPDEFLKTWHPTFLIRHPAMQLPSLFRTCLSEIELDGKRRSKKEPYEAETTMKWVRTLYDFYLGHFGEGGEWPVVLDADDVMMYPELVVKYAELVGLDSSNLKFSWDKASQDKLDKLRSSEKRMLSSILASSGVDKGKVAGSIDIDKEAEKWKSEFGEDGGSKLERWVRDAMPDYEYLRSKRLTVG